MGTRILCSPMLVLKRRNGTGMGGKSHLARAGALCPAELQGYGVTGVTQRAAEQPQSHHRTAPANTML